MCSKQSTPRRQLTVARAQIQLFGCVSPTKMSNTHEGPFFLVRDPSNPRWPKSGLRENLMVTPRLPRLPTLAVAHAPAGSHDRWVQSAAMVASRPTVMAPPRSHAPPRAFLAHFNAQKMANARLKHASGSRLTLRSKTAQARRSLTATQELRDTFATIDAEGTWGLGPSPARARTARTRPARAADRGVARPTPHPSYALKRVSVRKEPFRGFRHWAPFPRRFRGFVKRETARARRKRSKRDWKNREKRNLPRGRFFRNFRKSAKAGKTDRRPVGEMARMRRTVFGFTSAFFVFFHPRSGAAADRG